MSRWGLLVWPARYWARQSLRARLTLLATALFSIATATGAVLVIVLHRYALLRVLDGSAMKSAIAVKHQVTGPPIPSTVNPTTGVTAVQVLSPQNALVASSPGPVDRSLSYLTPEQLLAARHGKRFNVTSTTGVQLRVLAIPAGRLTVVVYTDISRVDDSVRVLAKAALIGAPIAVLLVGLSMYFVTSITLRSVAALRHGAADITAAGGLSGQRLPVPSAQDEIHRLAVTLNQMLDRIESASRRQRTFVGDAAHELRSPLASLRVQLEVAARLGPNTDWPDLIDEVLIDVGRLDRLVEDLLRLARLDETGTGSAAHEPVDLGELVTVVAGGYEHGRVPVVVDAADDVTVLGDRDGLHRVVVNLVDNALRYAQTQVDVGVTVDGRNACLSVMDDGPGLPETERERVFDRFYRVEMSRSRDSGGTGLGLPIVRDVLRAHEGTVRLADRADGKPGLQAVVLIPRER
ncbi:MAG TPA: HAMP domain-containing sensor histidine kinase [Jatrophihabitans sp.]